MRRYPFSTFKDFNERYNEFIKFIEKSSKSKEIIPKVTLNNKRINHELAEKKVIREAIFNISLMSLILEINNQFQLINLSELSRIKCSLSYHPHMTQNKGTKPVNVIK